MSEVGLKERQRSTPLENKLIHNFYLSYKFSQGRPDTQRGLMVAVSRMYPQEEVRREFLSTQSVNDRLRTRINNLRLPRDHTDIASSGVSEEFSETWKKQLRILAAVQIGDFQDGSNYSDPEILKTLQLTSGHLLADVVKRMAESDGRYFRKGRPGRKDGKADESFVKTYIVDQTPTTSPELDQLFRQARGLVLRALSPDDRLKDVPEGKSLKDRIQELQRDWEAIHPGEQFYEAH